MTTQTEAQRLSKELLFLPHTADWLICRQSAAELLRLESDKDNWIAASFVFKERALKAEARVKELEAANAELLEALSTYVSFAAMRREHLGKLTPVMEAVDAKARAAIRARKPA